MFLQIAAIALQFAMMFIIAWLILRMRRSQGRRVAIAPTKRTATGQRKIAEMLSAVSQILNSHSNELGRFERSLRNGVNDPGNSSDILEDHLDQVRRANRAVETNVEKTVDALVAVSGDDTAQERDRLKEYQRHTKDFDQTLEGVDRETLLAGIATELLSMVHQLRKENVTVREEVAKARDEAVELMGRVLTAEQAARLDSLTQLPNRRAFDEAMTELDRNFQHSGQPYSLVLFDVDFFKLINDQHGHSAGDAVLAMMGRVMRENRRPTDIACRIGGEEFALLLSNCNAICARQFANSLRQKVQLATLRYDGVKLSVTVSGGVAEASRNILNRTLLQRADSALYTAKQSGRNRVCVSSDATIAASPEAPDASVNTVAAAPPALSPNP